MTTYCPGRLCIEMRQGIVDEISRLRSEPLNERNRLLTAVGFPAGAKLFHHFAVTAKAERVIYLIPEAGLAPFSARVKTFHLQEHVQSGRLFCRTLSAEGQLSLTDPRLLDAVKGADVFLDTAIRFMDRR